VAGQSGRKLVGQQVNAERGVGPMELVLMDFGLKGPHPNKVGNSVDSPFLLLLRAHAYRTDLKVHPKDKAGQVQSEVTGKLVNRVVPMGTARVGWEEESS
jgi:hypothetical protein